MRLNPFVSRKKHERILEQATGSNKKIQELETKLKELEEVSGIYKRRIARTQESHYLFSGGTESDGSGYTEVTKNYYDLNYNDYWEVQKQCAEIFKINPYAKRIIEMMTDFTIGDGVTYSVDEDYENDLLPVLDKFWNDYDNNLDENLEGMCNELFVFGEAIYPVAQGASSRVIRIGHIDPRMASKITKREDRQKRLGTVFVKQDDKDQYGDKQLTFAVLGDVNGKLGTTPEQQVNKDGFEYKGECFVFQLNKLPSETRGYSELMTMLDTLDLLDQFVFQVAERSLLMYHFIMDITLKGASEQAVLEYQAPNPKVSSYHIHNDKVESQILTPDLKAVDAEALVRTVTRFALAGVGIPEHWIVAGDNTNYATAKEQNTPIEKRLENRQRFVKNMLMKMIRYQYEQHFTSASEEKIQEYLEATHINMPSVSGVDREYRAQVLKMTGEALMIAVSQGMITLESASNEFVNLANKYGMKLSVKEQGDEENPDGPAIPKDIMDELEDLRKKQNMPKTKQPEKVLIGDDEE